MIVTMPILLLVISLWMRLKLSESPAAVAATRILVVDDESTIRLVLSRYLVTRGFEVETAESGDAALDALSRARFDLMLCDVRMPGLSGVEILPRAPGPGMTEESQILKTVRVVSTVEYFLD